MIKAVKIVLDVTYSDGSRDSFVYIAVGYDIAIPRAEQIFSLIMKGSNRSNHDQGV